MAKKKKKFDPGKRYLAKEAVFEWAASNGWRIVRRNDLSFKKIDGEIHRLRFDAQSLVEEVKVITDDGFAWKALQKAALTNLNFEGGALFPEKKQQKP